MIFAQKKKVGVFGIFRFCRSFVGCYILVAVGEHRKHGTLSIINPCISLLFVQIFTVFYPATAKESVTYQLTDIGAILDPMDSKLDPQF